MGAMSKLNLDEACASADGNACDCRQQELRLDVESVLAADAALRDALEMGRLRERVADYNRVFNQWMKAEAALLARTQELEQARTEHERLKATVDQLDGVLGKETEQLGQWRAWAQCVCDGADCYSGTDADLRHKVTAVHGAELAECVSDLLELSNEHALAKTRIHTAEAMCGTYRQLAIDRGKALSEAEAALHARTQELEQAKYFADTVERLNTINRERAEKAERELRERTQERDEAREGERNELLKREQADEVCQRAESALARAILRVEAAEAKLALLSPPSQTPPGATR